MPKMWEGEIRQLEEFLKLPNNLEKSAAFTIFLCTFAIC